MGQFWRTAEPHDAESAWEQFDRDAAGDLVRLTSKPCLPCQNRACLREGTQGLLQLAPGAVNRAVSKEFCCKEAKRMRYS